MKKKERLLLVNRVCEQFESQLKSGASGDLERVLDDTAKEHPDLDLLQALLPELIALEVYYSDDREAAAASLASRFPEQSATIQNALSQPSVHATLAAGGDQTNAVADSVGAPLPSVRVGKRFADLKHHASGGLGDVYIGYDKSVRRQVAVKLLKPEFVSDAEAKSRFHNEAAITGALEHPGIVPIYDSGISEEGQPFYAMRLLGGDTLKDAVVSLHKNPGAEDFEERQRQLIRRLIDVCDAISYAHDNGVIHRDLKPANVVLGSHGDSVVIDWGLARSNSNPVEEPEASEPLTDSADQQFQTRLGSVLGTPEYMSPEQASGNPETVGTSSDIYSLGAILYSVLTGVAPIGTQAGTIQERIELARRADFPTAKQRVSSIPAALNEICSRAMRVNPAERYATPRELARDLDNWLSDQPVVAKPDTMLERGFRFLRKHRRWAAAAAATLVAITVGSTVAATIINKQSGELETRRSEAERQAKENAGLAVRESKAKEQALANEKSARQQSQFAFGTLTAVVNDIQSGLQKVPGSSDIRRRLLTTSLARLESLSTQHLNQVSVDKRTLDALVKMGDLVLSLGAGDRNSNPESALTGATRLAERYYQRGHEIARQMATDSPNDGQAQRVLSATHNKLGDVHLQLGDTQAALKSYREGLEVCRVLVESEESNVEAQRQLSICYNNVGDVQNLLGDAQAALKSYNSCNDVLNSLADSNEDPQAQRDLSISYDDLGDIQLQLGDAEGALRSYTACHEIRRSLAESDRDNAELQRNLSLSYNNLGDVRLKLGDTEAALKSYQSCHEIRLTLADSDRGNMRAQRDLSVSYNNLGDVQLKLGDVQAALESYNDCLVIRRALAESDKDNPWAQRDLAVSYNKLSNVQLRIGDWRATLRVLSDGHEIIRALAESDKENAQAQKDLMISHYKMGEVRRNLRDYSGSAREFEVAGDVLSEMIRRKQLLSFARPAKAKTDQLAGQARAADLTLGDWDRLLKQPAESLPKHLENRALGFSALKDFANAVQAAAKLRELDKADSENLYNAACVFALAAASVKAAKGEELSKEQTEQRQTWTNEAMATLKQAVEAGWTDFDHMQKDTDLTILRELPQFKALMESKTEEKP